MIINSQQKNWSSTFGNKYTLRNNTNSVEKFNNLYKKQFGYTRTKINKQFIKYFKKDFKFLEIGCNVGFQLDILKKNNFNNLNGVDIQSKALNIGIKKRPYINFFKASSDNLSFLPDKSFDVVFTTNFLIHLNKKNLTKTIKEMIRISSKYVWCMEYFSEKRTEILYRGKKNLLWKDNFKKTILKKKLKLIKSEKIPYINPNEKGNIDEVFLLKKI